MKKKAKAVAPDKPAHRLIIVSLQKKLAVKCSCGKWDLKYNPAEDDTPAILRKLATESHGAHVKRVRKQEEGGDSGGTKDKNK